MAATVEHNEDILGALVQFNTGNQAFCRNEDVENIRRHLEEDESITLLVDAAAIRALRAALAESERDAGRYRFLHARSPFGNRVPHVEQYPSQKFEVQHPHFAIVGLNEAIDAAMAAQEKAK